MVILLLIIWIMLGIIFGPSVAIYLAYDRKGYYRILEHNFWDDVQYWIFCVLFTLLPLWLLIPAILMEVN